MGVAAAGIAAAAIGAGASIYASEQQKKQSDKGLKAQQGLSAQERADRAVLSDRVDAEAQLAREQLTSSETARGLVLGQLGRPGTYGPTGAGQGEFAIDLGASPRGLEGLSPTAPGASRGLYGDRTISGTSEGGGKYSVEGQVADPFETAKNITDQEQFKAVSGLVAEAVQLGNREGPLWDQLNNSVVGGVYESAAQLQRQQMEEISRAVARGGTARRAGFALAQKFQVQENINRQRTQQLWQSKLKLEEYRNQTIQGNLAFAQKWVDNQAGIRDTFTSALTNLRTFWSSTMPALAIPAGISSLANQSTAQQMATDAQLAATTAKSQAITGAVESISGGLMTVLSNADSGGTPGQNLRSSTDANNYTEISY